MSRIYKKRIRKTIGQRFWSKVDIKGLFECWVYQGAITTWGYGEIRYNDKMIKAHRLSWEIHFGDIPDGMQVNHKCHNRACVNPAHLYVGTQQDNMNDKVRAGRQAFLRGENCGSSKLTEKEVIKIRYLRENGLTYSEIAKVYGVSKSTIRKACKKKSWVHV